VLAGGISDGVALRAAVTLGADLAYMGTRFIAAAESLRVPMPLASLLRDRFLRLFAHGGDNLDWSAIGGLATLDAGDQAERVLPCSP